MNIKQKLAEIEKLEVVETPWEVHRVLGHLEIFGSQICFRSEDTLDYVELHEAREAVKWLVEQFGGYVVWDESVKKEKKK